MAEGLGVAVIGAGMAGRAHAAAYRTASALYSPVLPPVRLVSIGDVNAEFGSLAARRFGYERNDTSWQAIAEADDIDVVSVVIANSLHREVVEGLLAAGKHVLCEKPLSDSLEDARAMASAANTAARSDIVAKVGFTFRRTPGIAYIRELIQSGDLGKVLHFSGRYWTDYGCDPHGPMSWRFKGPAGSGALADVGSHMAYVSEFLCGDMTSVSGGQLSTVITERPLPLGAVMGHDHAEVSDVFEPVTNDDYAAFSATFENGAGAIEVSRVAAGHANSLIFEVFCENGAGNLRPASPVGDPVAAARGQVRAERLPAGHPRTGTPVPGRRPGDGRPERRFRPERRVRLPGAGVPGRGRRHRRGLLAAALRHLRRGRTQHGTARRGRRASAARQRKEGLAVKLGVYNASLHDRPLPEALKVIADLGLTGIEINSGGFLPPTHIPTFDDILVSDTARDDYLGLFEGTGVSIAGLNCNGNPLHPNKIIGDKHAEDIRRSIRLANRLGQNRVVTMSGLPGGEAGASHGRTGSSTPGTLPPWTSWTTSGESPPRSGRTSTPSPPRTTSRSPSSCTRRTWCSTPPTCSS